MINSLIHSCNWYNEPHKRCGCMISTSTELLFDLILFSSSCEELSLACSLCHCWTYQWAVWCGLPTTALQIKKLLAQVKWLLMTSNSHKHTCMHNSKISTLYMTPHGRLYKNAPVSNHEAQVRHVVTHEGTIYTPYSLP